MATTVQWTLDVHDTPRMAEFWSAALGFEVAAGDDGCATLYAPGAGPDGPVSVWLQATTAQKTGKNRCHPDLVAPGGDLDAEVERLVRLGATHVDIGQSGSDGLVVLGDPEGNEFCVLRDDPRDRYR